MPPNISVGDNVIVDKRTLAKAYSFYTFTLGAMKLGGISSTKRSIITHDYKITVYGYKNSIYGWHYGHVTIENVEVIEELVLEEGGIYMESGFLDVINTAIGNTDTNRPSLLNFNTRIQTYMDSNPNQTPMQGLTNKTSSIGAGQDPDFFGEYLLDGSNSKSIGCILNEGDLFCSSPDSMVTEKKLAQKYPPSIYSGKLRLLVQALYGSNRYVLTEDEQNGTIGLSLPGTNYNKVISSGFGPSHGLFTTSDYKYFLIEVRSTSIKYYPLVISDEGEKFLDVIREGASDIEYIKRIEAYALSTATIQTEILNDGGSIIDRNGVIYNLPQATTGFPWYYGWHWLWDGSQGDVCLSTEDFDNSQYMVRKYSMAITHSVVGEVDIFTEVLTLLESNPWWPAREILNIVIPFPFENNMIGKDVVKNESGLSKQDPITTNMNSVTLHVYRSMTDELIECKYEQTLSSDTTTEELGFTIVCTDDTTPVFVTKNELVRAGARGSNKLTVGNTTINGQIDTYDSYEQRGGNIEGFPDSIEIFHTQTNLINRLLATCDGSTLMDWLESTGLFIISGSPAQARRKTTDILFGTREGNTRTVVRKSNSHRVDYSTAMFVEIPYNDCNSIIFGRLTNTDEDNITDTLGNYASNLGHVHFVKVYVSGSPVAETTMQYFGASSSSTTTDVITTIDATSKVDIDLYINEDGADQKIYVVDTISDPTQSFSKYFNWSYGLNMEVDNFDFIRENTSGEYAYKFNFHNSDNHEYDGTISVGWS